MAETAVNIIKTAIVALIIILASSPAFAGGFLEGSPTRPVIDNKPPFGANKGAQYRGSHDAPAIALYDVPAVHDTRKIEYETGGTRFTNRGHRVYDTWEIEYEAWVPALSSIRNTGALDIIREIFERAENLSYQATSVSIFWSKSGTDACVTKIIHRAPNKTRIEYLILMA